MSVFHMLAVEKDNEGYYVTRWDRAIPVEVEAETRAEAFKKLWAILGDAPRGRGWSWTAKVKRITVSTETEATS